MALTLKHQSLADFVARVREAYRNGSPERIVQIARFIIARIQTGDLTDTQVRQAFGLNTTQWNTLKTKMQNYVAASNTVRSAAGE